MLIMMTYLLDLKRRYMTSMRRNILILTKFNTKTTTCIRVTELVKSLLESIFAFNGKTFLITKNKIGLWDGTVSELDILFPILTHLVAVSEWRGFPFYPEAFRHNLYGAANRIPLG